MGDHIKTYNMKACQINPPLPTNNSSWFLSLFLVIITLHHLTATTVISNVESQGSEVDRIALLAIKTQFVDHPQGPLTSWNHSLHHCYWEGVTCGRKHNRVTLLNLSSRSLAGTISPSVGNMSFLRQLLLNNNSLHGQIPSEVGLLYKLNELDLSNNTLVGGIPANLSGCVALQILSVGFNRLSGQLPTGLNILSKLRIISIHRNNFIGPLFKAIANLTSLEQILGEYNAFSGTIPESIARMRNLSIVGLGSNDLSGIIPPSIFNLSSLQSLELIMNRLKGSLPQDIEPKLPRLTNLNLAVNYLTGPLPRFITNLSSLENIGLSTNNFTRGSLDFGTLRNLQRLSLSYNNQGGSIDFISTLVNCSDLRLLDLIGNDFTGTLPKSVVNLSTSLTWFGIGLNQISGEIPGGFSNLINLQRFVLHKNRFTGTIPQDIGKLQKLEMMALESNTLHGDIPSSFGNLSRLSGLYLAENKLQGRIPSSLGSCQSLLYLDLSNNDLGGTLPNELFGGLAKFLTLDLSQNHLEGSLPLDISKQTNLEGLDVSGNELRGEIPNGLGNCPALQYLNMEGNSFHGYIPPSFSSLGSLQTLDLSTNNLSGQIPDYFSRFPLIYLNLSHNNFEGEIPTNGVFANVSAISLVGNGRLCGGIPQLGLPRCMQREQKRRRRMSRALKLMITIICALVGVAIAVLLYLTCHKRKRKPDSPSSSMREAFLKVSYNMLAKATDGFSSENLLGAGTFGSVFKGVLEPYEKTVAVKVLNLQCQGAAKSFMAECKALRNIRHRNLVGIVTACSSIDFQGNDFKALVYDFMPNGSLDRWLHDDVGNLSLHQRVDIAIDVACALNYLHHDCEIPIVHCDLKPSNILLDDNMVAHVGDFGLAKFLPQHQNPGNNSSIGIRGTVGYAPPEYGLGAEVSKDGDVYSYGILVLELMIGKRPSDNMFKEDFNLPMYAKAALPHQVLQIVDSTLKENESEEANDRRPDDSVLEQRVECMFVMVKIGVACSNQAPQDRMKITDAISELRLARDILFNGRQGCNFQRGTQG